MSLAPWNGWPLAPSLALPLSTLYRWGILPHVRVLVLKVVSAWISLRRLLLLLLVSSFDKVEILRVIHIVTEIIVDAVGYVVAEGCVSSESFKGWLPSRLNRWDYEFLRLPTWVSPATNVA